MSMRSDIGNWRRFYSETFGVSFSIDKIKIPKARPGFPRIIIVGPGLTPDRIYDACAARFPCVRHYMNLDRDVAQDEREAQRAYAVLVRGGEESDPELAAMSAESLRERKINAITLCEYLLYQLKHFTETRTLLDRKHVTMCAGSRYRDGRVPTAISHRGELKLHWCAPDEENPRLRAREVIAQI